jgi:hypothetical protein
MLHGLLKATQWFFTLTLLVLMAAGLLGTGCQQMAKADKHWRSGWNGLDRTISVYTDQGVLFGRWNAKTYVETRPPVVAFLDSAGKEVKLMGGIIVVQER